MKTKDVNSEVNVGEELGKGGLAASPPKKHYLGIVSFGRQFPVIVSLAAIAIFFQIESSYFLTPRNLTNLVGQTSTVAFLALAEVLVLLLGEIDLSVGSVSGVCAAFLAVTVSRIGAPWWAGIALMLVIGVMIGLFQGSIVAYMKIPSFMVTLAGLLAWLGLQLKVLGSVQSVSVFSHPILGITSFFLPSVVSWSITLLIIIYVAVRSWRESYVRGNGLNRQMIRVVPITVVIAGSVVILNLYQGVPLSGAIVVLVVASFWWITKKTKFGVRMYAVGGSSEASYRAGINVNRIRVAAFALAGLMAAMSGLMSVSYEQSAGTLTGGGTVLLEAVGAAVIGGTSLFGGSGSAWSAIAGSLVLVGIANGLDLMSEGAPVKYMVQGVVVLGAVVVDRYVRSRRNSSASM